MGYGVLLIRHNTPQLITMGVLQLGKMGDHYLKLKRIFERVLGLIEQYHPDEMAIEAPFFGKNVQSMLKLGRARVLPWQRPCTETFPSPNMPH